MAKIQKDMQVILKSIQQGTPSKLTNKENQLQAQTNCERDVGRHFTTIKIRKSWDDAEAYCRVMGGHLATFKNKEEFDLITGEIDPSERYWLGINDRAKENNFVSVDFGKKVTFFEWGLAEPNNAAKDAGLDEDCVELKDLKMNDSECTGENFFICQN
ncbi:C-type lectin 37Db-like [Drosophila takahashii]|uniref:C-type lectin 37Db-like n=1 Tax=Drosophila takahashii TaxID=29030 RepID=UPI001CF88C9B|nr:C-type lectin 37Db-like [Drosophila takahashii]